MLCNNVGSDMSLEFFPGMKRVRTRLGALLRLGTILRSSPSIRQPAIEYGPTDLREGNLICARRRGVSGADPVPKGRMRIARRFNAGCGDLKLRESRRDG